MDLESIIANIKGITSDSRDVQSGYLFAALPGMQFDGRDFIDQAIENGALYILAPAGTLIDNATVNLIESINIRQDFARLAAAFYGAQPNHIVAVTGTNGKTSTVDFIRQMFEMHDLKTASLGTLGLISKTVQGENKMTTPDPVKLHGLLADLKSAGVEHVAMEASSHGLDQRRLDGVNIQVAAFTNFTQDHLDYHQTMDDYFKAKKRLFTELLPQHGKAVLNIDDPYLQNIDRCDLSFGQSENATLRLLSQVPTALGQDLKIDYQGNTYNISLNLIGLFQAYNALCAAGCSIMMGIDPDFIFKNMYRLQGVAGRAELAASYQNRAAYIDYAHTPDALEKILTSLRPHVSGRLICVFGAGGDRDKVKRPQMGRVVAQYADHAILTDDNPRGENPDDIRTEILTACPDADNIGDRKKAIQKGVAMLQDGDVMLVAGKGHEGGQMIGNKIIPFSDLEITRDIMTQEWNKG